MDCQAFLSRVIFLEALRRGVHTLILIPDNGTTSGGGEGGRRMAPPCGGARGTQKDPQG